MTVLSIEDDDAAFLAITMAFQDSGCDATVLRAPDGDQAMPILERQQKAAAHRLPDLILLDLNLPGRDGWEVLSELKQVPVLRNIPVVILSTSRDPADHTRSLASGAKEYFTKPSSYAELIEIVHAICLETMGQTYAPRQVST